MAAISNPKENPYIIKADGSDSPHSMSAAAASGTSVTEDSIVGRLLVIFQKAKSGIELTAAEKSFIREVSSYTPTFYERCCAIVFTSKEDAAVREIDNLAHGILSKRVSGSAVFGSVERMLIIDERPSARQAASLARLIEACLARDEAFPTILSDFHRFNGREPSRGELIDLVASFNRGALPHPSRAGNVICYVGPFSIQYNSHGFLMVREGPISPLDLSFAQVLKPEQVEEVQTIYTELADRSFYNNLGELLEFVKFYREEKSRHPELTLSQAYDAYNPDLERVFDKYESGTCILLATKFCRELERRGIQSQCLGNQALNSWTSMPIPGTESSPIKWEALSDEIRGMDHTSAICHYRVEGEEGDSVLKFECSFEKDHPEEMVQYSPRGTKTGSERFLENLVVRDSTDLPNQIVDHGFIGKARLKGRFKAVASKDGKSLGVDFLRGNFYINPSWAKTLPGLPLNAAGMASISLENLANPDAVGTYFVDGSPVELTHRDALRMILDRARATMVIPPDMEENIITLAQCLPDLFDHFFIQPLPLIKTLYRDLSMAGKKMAELKATMEFTAKYRALQREFDAVIEDIYYNRPVDASTKMEAFKLRLTEVSTPIA